MRTSSKVLFFLFLFSPAAFAFDLEGEVKLEPPFPAPALLEISEKHSGECGKQKVSPKLTVSPEGFLANAVVKVEGTLPERNSPAGEFVLDQIECEFKPHVLLVPKGATVKILNSEAMLHNVRAFDERTEMLFNDAMPKKGQVLKKRFDTPGRIAVRCGVHHWMHAVLVVMEHPYYALTDEKGHFKLEGIPEGNYTLSVWHESLGELKAPVTPDTSPLTLTYPPKTDAA